MATVVAPITRQHVSLQSRGRARRRPVTALGANGLFWVLSLQLALLLGLLVLQVVLPLVPHNTLLLGVVPLAVPWAGAVGGVVNALIALGGHSELWFDDPNQGREFNIWYLARLPVSATLGTVAAGIVAIFLHTVDVTAADDGTFTYTPLAKASLALVAFAIGYHQKAFDGLFTRLMSAILGQGTAGGRQAVTTTDAVDFGTVKVGGSSTRLITLTNATKESKTVDTGTASVKGTDEAAFSLLGLPVTIVSGAAADIQVEFVPTAAKRYSAAVTFSVGDSSTSVVVEGTGT
jgi:hypothetical protein